MKHILSLVFGLIVASSLMAQPPAPAVNPQTPPAAPVSEQKQNAAAPIRFDLDFKGGSIRALFDAIGKARGQPVNVYLPHEAESIPIDPFHVSGVTVKELLDAVSNSGAGRLSGNLRERLFHYSFFATPADSDSAVWSVRVEDLYTPSEPICRVYSLSPYLDTGLSVDDITTAIRTAWKMLNYTPSTVNLSYHRETKLLIAVAPEDELKAVEQVLSALPKGQSGKKAFVAPSAEPPKSTASKL